MILKNICNKYTVIDTKNCLFVSEYKFEPDKSKVNNNSEFYYNLLDLPE